jgi:hypothetical protein
MTLADLLHICERYNKLGWAVQDQLTKLVNRNAAPAELNSNALSMIVDFLEDALNATEPGESNDELIDDINSVFDEITEERDAA